MNIFLDTEFNGFGGELLSTGMVADDGKRFYEYVTPGLDVCNWVEKNVVPVLPYQGDPLFEKEPSTLPKIKAELEKYLNQYRQVTIVADWLEDIKYFCDLVLTGLSKCACRCNSKSILLQ